MNLLERCVYAIAMVAVGFGLLVIMACLPPVPKPRAGGVWVPTRGRSEPRIVEAVSACEVICFRGGKQRAMSLGGWHRWVQRTRAKEQA